MFKKTLLIIFIGFAAIVLLSYFLFQKETSYVSEVPDANETRISINGIEVLVDIADDPYEQSQGLSGRDKMAENKGMLFVFTSPIMPEFWMKEMKFSLDLIWIDASGTIIEIHKNISPDTYPQTFYPPSPIKYVLEVNAGWSDRNNIKVGDILSF